MFLEALSSLTRISAPKWGFGQTDSGNVAMTGCVRTLQAADAVSTRKSFSQLRNQKYFEKISR